MSTQQPLELVVTVAAFGLLAVYHLLLVLRVRRAPMTTTIGITNRARRAWVRSVMQDGRDILAVQTLRNWVMASTFLASTAVLASLGLTAAAVRGEVSAAALLSLSFFEPPSATFWTIRLLVVAAVFFHAFLSFALSVRYYNHACLLINIPAECDPTATVESVTAIVNRAALHYTIGMRDYYLAVPLALWLFGPLWLLGAAIVLVAFVYSLDRSA